MPNGGPTAKPAVGLFAKPPLPGSVKTRLSPPLSPSEAARLYAAFLGDLAAMLAAQPAWDWIVYSPDPDALRAAWPPDAPRPSGWRRQTGADLGQRMESALGELIEDGRSGAVLLGSDHPTVSGAMMGDAFRALESADIVLGPSFDGGLYLVGATSRPRDLFLDVPWSTDRVLEVVVARARTRGVRVGLLPPWYDVDDAKDLAFLRAHLGALSAALGTGAPCPRTRAVLSGFPESLNAP
jgi:uncharacterized protein